MSPNFVRKHMFSIVALFAASAVLMAVPDVLAQTRTGQPSVRPLIAGTRSTLTLSRDAWAGSSRKAKRASATPGPQGIGFFSPVPYQTGADNPLSIAIADLDGDGKPDLVIANQCAAPDFCDGPALISVLRGNGDGTFQPAVTYSSGGSVLNYVAVADLNGDGIPDIIAANACNTPNFRDCSGSSIGVLLGNGDGTFRAAVSYDPAGYTPTAIVVADVNGDGHPDLLVMNLCASACDNIGPPQGSVSVLLGKGDGTFVAAVSYASGGYFSYSVAAADLNGDGRTDLVVTNYCSTNVEIGSCPNPGLVDVLLGNGDGTFQPAIGYGAAGFGTHGVAIADVNNDGKPDLLVANCGSEGCGGGDLQGAISVLPGRGDGTFETGVNYGSGSFNEVMAADLDGDGKLDIVAVNGVCGSFQFSCVYVFPGNGDGTFQSPIVFDQSTGNDGYTDAAAVADLNGDGALDLAVTHGFGNGLGLPPGTVDVLLNNIKSLASTTTALISSVNPSLLGQSVTFSATVSSSSVTPTGSVVFYDGATSIGSVTLTNGSGSVSTSTLAVGSHSITAAYQGSSGFASSTSAPLTQVVNSGPAPTSTSLTSSGNPCLKPCGVTFTATVTSSAGTPTGTVSFSDDEPRFLGTATLSGGIASIAPGGFHHGTWQITATYNGSNDFAPSTSPVLYQDVYEQPVPTQTYVSTSGSPSFVGQPVTFSAGVSPNRGDIPNGETLTFYDGHKLLGQVPMSGEGAQLTTSSLDAGKHNILVTYDGDGLYEKSHGTVAQVVVKYSTTTTLVSSVNPSVSGQPVTMTVTVTSSGPTPTGVVMLKGFGTLTLAGGTASATKSNFTVGSHSLTAKYKGDDDSAASTSEVLVQVVNPD